MSTHAKEDFWIGAKGGLVEWKHYLRMGNAVWLFLHLLRCQTALSPLGEGVVYYGHPITLDSIRRETCGIPVRTLKDWVIRLREQGYIRTEDHGCRGLVFWIANAKHKTKKQTIQRTPAKIPRKAPMGFGRKTIPLENGTGHEAVPIAARLGQESVRIETPERPQVNEPATIAAESISPISKGLTPTSLSNHNKAAAAQNAAFLTSLLGKRNFNGMNQQQPRQQTPKPKAKPVDAAFIAWQERHAEGDPSLAQFRKAHKL